tara:strand:- start:1531 stop:2007 length:477 start_codon:yes stop_codon:yes gene_type:complete
MMVDGNTIVEPPEQIDEWFINYAEGCPPFAGDVKEELLALKDETRVLRDAFCLAAALTINSRDLVHDITQSMMMYQKDLFVNYDEICRLTVDAIKDFTCYGPLDGNHLDQVKDGGIFLEGDVRTAVAIAMGVHLNDKHPDIQRIRELVSLIKRVHILI